jgi:hypothetical protein
VAVVALDVAPVLGQSWSVDVADPVLLQTIQDIQLCHSEPFCRTPALSQDPIEDAGLQEVQGLQEAPGFMGSVMHMGTAAMCVYTCLDKESSGVFVFLVLETYKNRPVLKKSNRF